MNRVYKSTKREKPVSPLVSYWRRLDKPLILAALLCSLLSIILLYSIWQNHIISSVGASYYRTQLLSCGLGMVCLLVLSAIDYHKIVRLWFLYAPIALVLTLLTFTALGHRRAGADDQAWLNLGFIQFQPSEVLKLAFILTFSLHLAKDEGNMNKPLHMLLLCVHGAIPTGLIALQGDYGTAIVFAVIFLGMLFAAKISWKYVLAFLIAIPAALVVAWNFLLGDTHKKRILVLLHPGTDPENIEYQQDRGLEALSNGQDLRRRSPRRQGKLCVRAGNTQRLYVRTGGTGAGVRGRCRCHSGADIPVPQDLVRRIPHQGQNGNVSLHRRVQYAVHPLRHEHRHGAESGAGHRCSPAVHQRRRYGDCEYVHRTGISGQCLWT